MTGEENLGEEIIEQAKRDEAKRENSEAEGRKEAIEMEERQKIRAESDKHKPITRH